MQISEALKAESEATKEARYNVPYTLDSVTAIAKIAGEAICHVDGVLGLKSRLGDIFKRSDDISRGVSVEGAANYGYSISARLIVDESYVPARVVDQAKEAIAYSLKQGAGLVIYQPDIEADAAMSREEFYEKYGADKSCECARDEYL